jgi:hypothetical protein
MIGRQFGEKLIIAAFPEPDRAVRQYLQEMGDTTSPYLAQRWRLRYAAFLCAVFDVSANHLRKGVPSEFAKIFESPSSKTSYFDEVIQQSNVGFFFFLENLCLLSSR